MLYPSDGLGIPAKSDIPFAIKRGNPVTIPPRPKKKPTAGTVKTLSKGKVKINDI